MLIKSFKIISFLITIIKSFSKINSIFLNQLKLSYVICADEDSACSNGYSCCKKSDESFSCCPSTLCCCKKGLDCCPCEVPSIKDTKYFQRERDNIFQLLKFYNDIDGNKVDGVVILFSKLPMCNGNIIYKNNESQEYEIINTNNYYPLYSNFIYKGDCQTNDDSFSFSFIQQNKTLQNVNLKIDYKIPPSTIGHFRYLGETDEKIIIEIDDSQLLEKDFSVATESLRIEFKSLPRKGKLYLNSQDEIQINIPYAQHIFIYISNHSSDNNYEDEIKFVIVNGYDLKSNLDTIFVSISPKFNIFQNIIKTISIIFGALAAVVAFFYTIYKCYRKKMYCFREKKKVLLEKKEDQIGDQNEITCLY